MSRMTPKEALAVLMALRHSDEKAHELIPEGEDLAIALIHLSDIAAVEASNFTVMDGDCHQAKDMGAFLARELPLEEMGKYGLHLTICMSCRTALSKRGIKPFDRSTEYLRQVLAEIKPDSKPAS